MGIIETIRRMLGCKCEEKDLKINSLGTTNTELKRQITELKTDSSTIIKEPKVCGTLDIKELALLLQPYCKNTFLSDMIYSTTTKIEASKYSKETKIQASTWIKEKYDCDEFSFGLMGYWNTGLNQFAFGIAWSGAHAFNIMVDKNKQIWIIEPQTNKFTKIEDMEDNKFYMPIRVIII